MMKDYESFLRFAEAKVTQQPGFFPRQILAEKDFLSQSIGEAFDHRCEIVIQKENSAMGNCAVLFFAALRVRRKRQNDTAPRALTSTARFSTPAP
jgi:hypothetical protein